MSNLRITQQERNVHRFHHTYKKGWEQWYLCQADAHLDNPKTRDDLYFFHLEQAKQRNAKILDFGDNFCAMQGKYDPRRSKKDIKPEHNVPNYLDALVDDRISKLSPYAQQFALFGYGNHETAILKNCETDLTQRLVKGLKAHNTQVFAGGYSGYVAFTFEHAAGGNTQHFKLWYEHGHGGGGAVTKGVIQHQRRTAFLSDADMVFSGHVHEDVTTKWPKIKLSKSFRVEQFFQRHVTLPTYKEEFEDGYGGYHVEKGRPPKPLGAYWIRFYYDRGKVRFKIIEADEL